MCMRIFFFNDTATTEIYTLSLHDALPISDTLYWGRREDYRGVYMGEMNALGQASGHGIYRGRNGFNYEGHWKNDKEDGFGIAMTDHHQLKVGEWKAGRFRGEDRKSVV